MQFKLVPLLLVTVASMGAPAQTAAPAQPLSAMPYSPSLDLTSLDRAVDACTDFYQFACGGWIRSNPIPADQASWNVYAKLATDNQQFLWGILEEDAKAKNRTPVQQKIGDYYASCMDTATIDAAGVRPVLPELERIAALRTRADLIAAIPRMHHEAPGSFFFDSGTDQDAMDSSTIVASLFAGGLGLPDRDYYLRTDAKSVEIREKYTAFVTTVLGLGGEPAADAGTTRRPCSASRRSWRRRR